jgi:Phosphotransferase enzyme family
MCVGMSIHMGVVTGRLGLIVAAAIVITLLKGPSSPRCSVRPARTAVVARTRQLALDCAAFAVTPVTTRIDTRVGRFVLRQRIREGPRPGADPLREVACHRAAAAAAVAPAVLDAAPDGSWILMDYVEGGMWTPPRLQAPEGLRTLGACLQRLHAIMPPKGLSAFDPVSIATGQAQAILERDPAAAAQVNALVARTRQLALDCAAFAVTPVTTHGDLNASNLIGPVPMLVDWEYAQLADPVYDLACLSVYYPGLRLRGGELLGTAGIIDANGNRSEWDFRKVAEAPQRVSAGVDQRDSDSGNSRCDSCVPRDRAYRQFCRKRLSDNDRRGAVKIDLPSKDVLANLRNLREEIGTLGNALREIKAGENPILQSEIARLREALTALNGSVDQLANARTILTDLQSRLVLLSSPHPSVTRW